MIMGIQEALEGNELTHNLKVTTNDFMTTRPSFEKVQAAFMEQLALINHNGVLATVTTKCQFQPGSAELLAMFLIGFLKGIACAEAEQNLPEVYILDVVQAWKCLDLFVEHFCGL
jgi:hypothetical protein